MKKYSDGTIETDYIYIAASKNRYYFWSMTAGRVRWRFQATLFWTRGEAASWCEGRRGWYPLRVGRKL